MNIRPKGRGLASQGQKVEKVATRQPCGAVSLRCDATQLDRATRALLTCVMHSIECSASLVVKLRCAAHANAVVFSADFVHLLTVFTCVSYAEARLSYTNSVCPSICLSVTRWYCIKTAEHIVVLSSPHDSPFILVLCLSRSSRNSDGVTPAGS